MRNQRTLFTLSLIVMLSGCQPLTPVTSPAVLENSVTESRSHDRGSYAIQHKTESELKKGYLKKLHAKRKARKKSKAPSPDPTPEPSVTPDPLLLATTLDILLGLPADLLNPAEDLVTFRLTRESDLGFLDTAALPVDVITDQSLVLQDVFESSLAEADDYVLITSLWRSGYPSGTLASQSSDKVRVSAGETITTHISLKALPTLSLTGLGKNDGRVGESVLIQGQGFSLVASENQVTLGGVAATVTEATSTQLTVIVPELPDGAHTWRIHVGSLMVGRTGFLVSH